jgi:WD40 repeat protein
MPQSPGYDAFISYSHLGDDELAATLQAGLETFGSPWYRSRALRVFRDTTNLTATPQLLSDIIEALSVSNWFILIASEEAARSRWVSEEVSWWLRNRDPRRMLIALSSGSIRWQGHDFDWSATTALPPALAGALQQEPGWVDLREAREALEQSEDRPRNRLRRRLTRLQARRQVGDWVADVAAPVRGMPKDALVGAHLRHRRRTRRLVRTVLASLLALSVATSAAAGVAVTQLHQAQHETRVAQRETRVATSRELTALSENIRGSHVDLAQLFAVEAYRLNPSPQALAALFQAVTASPELVTYMQASGTVSAVAGSANGRVIVAGLADGTIMRWSSPQARPVTIAHLAGSITSVSVDATGTAVVAMNRSGALWWSAAGGARPLTAPKGQLIVAAGISPSGRLAALGAAPPNPPGISSPYDIILFGQQPAPLKTATFSGVPNAHDHPQSITFPSETQLVVLNKYGISWHRLAVPGLATLGSWVDAAAADPFNNALSSGGAYFANSGGHYPIPVFPTTGAPIDLNSPPRSALTAGYAPNALAINAPGTLVAQADLGTIYVSRTAAHPTAAPLPLTGNTAINDGALTFAGPDRLVSASGAQLAVWDLGQYSRIATKARVPLSTACLGCANPQVTVRPDGRQVAIVSGPEDAMIILGLPSGSRSAVVHASSSGLYGPAMWLPGGNHLLLPTADGGAEVWSTAPALARSGGWRTSSATQKFVDYTGPGQGVIGPQVVSLRPSGRQLVEVDTSGDIMVRDTGTGQVDEAIKGPAIMRGGLPWAGQNFAAVDAAGREAAVDTLGGPVRVTSLTSKRSRTLPDTSVDPGGEGDRIGFYGERLLIQQDSGALQVWNADGTKLIKVIAGTPGTVAGPVTSGSGLAVEISDSGSGNVIDLKSGTALGTIGLPTGTQINSTGVGMTPDGSSMVTATEGRNSSPDSGELTDWAMSPSVWVKVACATAGHDLTATDWRDYVGGPAPGDLACAGSR